MLYTPSNTKLDQIFASKKSNSNLKPALWAYQLQLMHRASEFMLSAFCSIRQPLPLSQEYSYYNHLFLHPTTNLLPCPLKSKPSNTSQTTEEHPANLSQHTENLSFSSCSFSPFPLKMLEKAAATARAGQNLALLHLAIQSVLAPVCQCPRLFSTNCVYSATQQAEAVMQPKVPSY